jgi:deferrochelatase/peroxidase EfeB
MTDATGPDRPDEAKDPSRRRFLGAAFGTAGLVAAGGAGFGIARAIESDKPSDPRAPGAPASASVVPFYGEHQAGIATATQDRMAFAAFDITAVDLDQVRTMLALWASAAAQLTRGEPIGTVDSPLGAAPSDTGEAIGLHAARLTITVGFGPSFFDDRFGLQKYRPAALIDIPRLPSDNINPDISHGDIGVQACADDPQVAFHAIRNFARLARGTAVMRWSQLGFGRTSSTSTAQQTPRNLMGFKDGTRNVKAEDLADMDRHVWVGDETDQKWMIGGSYLVTRRIIMRIESWDTDLLGDQERVFGRSRVSGAPLTGKTEFDTPDFAAKNKDGSPVIDVDAHIRLAAPESHGGVKILRRGYSFTDGTDPDTGLLDAGLFFIAYQKDPRRQFVAIQSRLGKSDALNEYIQHRSSGLFAVPPGLSAPGDWWAKSLFA